ncbi:hypothetical protein RM530_17490 [Algiphilus sp. W345]|uniref:Transposase n=1 Tax=Banduia mediterranea TaxID=3075609 RepID=A0ABU2WNF0_9GAMM|nr:hypothetical protein [Algiphilus sp. W345]MDT0499139.1 hypothetical protein [Algiphilus sp. W345]
MTPEPAPQAERYRLIEDALRHFATPPRLSKADKGLIVANLRILTGYSRQQLTRLIGRFAEADVRLLAEVDALHDTPPPGPAVKKLCERAWQQFDDARHERLAGISVSHLYNLRHSKPCNDNALAESKNGAVVRKLLGYVHIPQHFAPRVTNSIRTTSTRTPTFTGLASSPPP